MKSATRNLVAMAFAVAGVMVIATTAPAARHGDSEDKKAREAKVKEAAEQSSRAAKAFDAVMQVPDQAIPRDLLTRAQAVAVFPNVIKVAATVGGQAGRGVVSRRTVAGWGPSVFFRGAGGSFGPQIGASFTDYFLLLMNDDSVEALMKDRFELGGEAAIAAGPVGRNAGAATDATMQAAILSYSRSRGLFAGLSLKGVVLKPEDDLNEAVYGKTARELLSDVIYGKADSKAGLKSFPQVIERYTSDRDSDR